MIKLICKNNKRGFSLIELVVTIAIIGILVMLATPKFMGYIERAELARIQHDVKIMEDKMAENSINGVKDFATWDDNAKDLGLLVLADLLYETEGKAKSVAKPRTQYGDVASSGDTLSEVEVASDYKIIPQIMSKKIKTNLPGTFYTNVDGKVYYEHDKPLTKIKEEILLSCESPEPLNYEFDEVTGTIVKYNGNLQHLIIPSAFNIEGTCYPVRIIGRGAFMRGNYNGMEQKPIKSIKIPSSVTTIEEDAFKDNDIETVAIPISITDIEDDAFSGNNLGMNSGGSDGSSNNRGVTIQSSGGSSGSGVGSNLAISSSAFSNNGPTGSPAITPQYKPVTSKDLNISVNVSTDNEGKKIATITEYRGNEKAIVIPDIIMVNGEEVVVEVVEKGAYQGKGLISVQFPEGLKQIDDYAFSGNQLVGVFIPSTVEHIGKYAFGYNEVNYKYKLNPTIRNIKIQEGEYINQLDKDGNIMEGDKKVDKLKGKVALLDYVFITSKSKLIIDLGSDGVITNKMPQQKIDEWVSKGYIPISTVGELQSVSNNLRGKYIQTNDIDLSNVENFEPIGEQGTPFMGTYNGGGFKIKNLIINNYNNNHVGLFGYATGPATISDVSLVGANIKGKNYTGGLVGYSQSTTINNSYVIGNISGQNLVGGLVGYSLSFLKISNSYVIGNIIGTSNVGGLIGYDNSSGVIRNSYTLGSINGNIYVGGLVGGSWSIKITNSYAVASIKGTTHTGGLVGSINYEYSAIKDSYYNRVISGAYGGGTGLSKEQMQSKATYTNWDFLNTWQIDQSINDGYPFLQ